MTLPSVIQDWACGCRWQVWASGRVQVKACSVEHMPPRPPSDCRDPSEEGEGTAAEEGRS